MSPVRPVVAVVTLDCVDSDALARFWGALLQLDPERRSGGYVLFPPSDGGGVRMALQQVPEPKRGKNRAHVDLRVDDLRAGCARVEKLGGRLIEEHASGSFAWMVMADPEGNEFCIFAGPDEPDA